MMVLASARWEAISQCAHHEAADLLVPLDYLSPVPLMTATAAQIGEVARPYLWEYMTDDHGIAEGRTTGA
jgi:hypothetical protein